MTSKESSRQQLQGLPSQGECSHSRVIDHELTVDGERTGRVICKECGAVVPDDPPA